MYVAESILKTLLAFLVIAILSACSSQTTQHNGEQATAIGSGATSDRTIALLGASGMAGDYVLREALSRGFKVRALARTPAKLDRYKNEITIIQGDARDASAIRRLLQNSDIVLSALGPVRADGDAARMVSTVATGHILQVMKESGSRRYLAVSGGAVAVPGDQRNFIGWAMQKMVALTLRATLRDKQAEYDLLANSTVPWTLIRCPIILDEPYLHKARSSLRTPNSFTLRAGELASFMINEIDANNFSAKAPFLYSE